jgi:uncharacterized protein YjcR
MPKLMYMEGFTIKEIAERLGITPDTAKKRLQTHGLKPIEYAGPTAIYATSVVEAIRNVPGKGRPKKSKDGK